MDVLVVSCRGWSLEGVAVGFGYMRLKEQGDWRQGSGQLGLAGACLIGHHPAEQPLLHTVLANGGHWQEHLDTPYKHYYPPRQSIICYQNSSTSTKFVRPIKVDRHHLCMVWNPSGKFPCTGKVIVAGCPLRLDALNRTIFLLPFEKDL